MKDYIYRVLDDPSFMGALLGAIITGGIALLIFYKDKNNTRRNNNEEFKRLFYIEVSLFHTHVIHLNEMLREFSKKEVKLPDVLPTLQIFTNKLQKLLKETDPRYLKNSVLREFQQITEIIDKLDLLIIKLNHDYQYYDQYTRDDKEDKNELIKIMHLLKDPIQRIDEEYGKVKSALDK